MIDVLGPEKRRRRTTQEKITIVQQSFEPGMTVSLVARQHGVAASQLFLWRKQYQEGSLTAVAAGEQVVPASELAAAMKQIKELQRLLGKKTMEKSRSRWTAVTVRHCTGRSQRVASTVKQYRTSCWEQWNAALAASFRRLQWSG
ncbi:unnamed protein product [Klebsiella pneumoniae subsp. rhinoscleromatis SB3432]|nr:unnamed protein product [Klebsiella pneumoniae subsp. rhinoscleromatis SB3432]